MTKTDKHIKLCNDLHELYVRKNAAYGDSFGETFKKLGIISAVTRISDKYNRLVNLATNPDINQNDESIRDTLQDLANYALMTIMELDEDYTMTKTVTTDNDTNKPNKELYSSDGIINIGDNINGVPINKCYNEM